MKLPKVDKFLFFFRLEIGGYVIAGVSIGFSVAFITFPSVLIARMLIFFNSLDEADQEFFRSILTVSSIFYSIAMVYFLILFVAAIFLIIGTLQQKHNFLVLHQIITFVFTVATLALIFQLNIVALVPAMLLAVVGIYFFICVHSLYFQFKERAKQSFSDYNSGAIALTG